MKSPDEGIPNADHDWPLQSSVFTGLGVAELLERLGVIGHVGALAVLVGGVDFVAAALDLDLAHFVAVGLKLSLERGLRLPLRLWPGRAFAFGESRPGGGDCDNGQGAEQLHLGLQVSRASRAAARPSRRHSKSLPNRSDLRCPDYGSPMSGSASRPGTPGHALALRSRSLRPLGVPLAARVTNVRPPIAPDASHSVWPIASAD